MNAFRSSKTFNCKRCGSTQGPKQCPAFGKKCKNCDRTGHFTKMCKSKKKTSNQNTESRNDKESKKVTRTQKRKTKK